MAMCNNGCQCRCQMTGCGCHLKQPGGLQVVGTPPITPDSLPKYKCCDHCKYKYCPGWPGHFVPCPIITCIVGKEQISKVVA